MISSVVELTGTPVLAVVSWLGQNPAPYVTQIPIPLIVFFAAMLSLIALWSIYRATTTLTVHADLGSTTIEHRVFGFSRVKKLDPEDRIVFARVYLFSKTEPRPVQRTAIFCRGHLRRWLFNDREWKNYEEAAAWIADHPCIRSHDMTRRAPLK